MGVLAEQGIEYVFHFTPLHYLPFIGRSQKLLNKPSLEAAGFAATHLRSKSSATDIERGFGEYTHLTIHEKPPILGAKLEAGFPHVGIVIPVGIAETKEFSLCRYNVAMTRQLRRDGKDGFPESATNGRYYGKHQIPIARDKSDQVAMLKKHMSDTMIEVLILGNLNLSDEIEIRCYSDRDSEIAKKILSKLGSKWRVVSVSPPRSYPDEKSYQDSVDQFIELALSDPNWKGNGLEFDKV